MALPTTDEIARLGQTETLPDIIFSDRFRCDFNEQETFAQLLAQMHNDGRVDLLAPLDEALVQNHSGYSRVHGIQIFERVLGKLNVPALHILRAFDTIYGNELNSYATSTALTEWCRSAPSRPVELLDLTHQHPRAAHRYQTLAIAIRCGLAVDEARFTKCALEHLKGDNETQRMASIQALCSCSFKNGELWTVVVDTMIETLQGTDNDALRSAILKAGLSWLPIGNEAPQSEIEQLIKSACVPVSAQIAHTAAYALAFNLPAQGLHIVEYLYGRILEAPLKPETIGVLDIALSNSLKRGGAERARTILEALILRPTEPQQLGHFQILLQSLRKAPQEVLDQWVISWLREGDFRLCRELKESLFEAGEDHLFSTDFSPVVLDDWETGFIARKAVATFFYQPGTLASFLASLARSTAGQRSIDLAALIFDPVLLNYPSLAESHFDAIAADPSDPANWTAQAAVSQLKRYLDGLQNIKMLPELKPSEREVQLESERHAEATARAMRDSWKDSLMADLGGIQRLVLYGNGMVTWHQQRELSAISTEALGNLARAEHPMTSVSYQYRLAREEFLDPQGLRQRLMAYRYEERTR